MSHSNVDLSIDGSFDETRVEALVRAARNYVVPTELLRPAFMDALKVVIAKQKLREQLLGIAIVIGLAIGAIAPLAYGSPKWTIPQAPTAHDMQVRAALIAEDESVGKQWAMVETFRQLRLAQSDSNRRMDDESF